MLWTKLKLWVCSMVTSSRSENYGTFITSNVRVDSFLVINITIILQSPFSIFHLLHYFLFRLSSSLSLLHLSLVLSLSLFYFFSLNKSISFYIKFTHGSDPDPVPVRARTHTAALLYVLDNDTTGNQLMMEPVHDDDDDGHRANMVAVLALLSSSC